MRIPGHYSDDTWQWLPEAADEPPGKAAALNSPGHVVWEFGLVLFVPLAGAGLVGLVLEALNIY